MARFLGETFQQGHQRRDSGGLDNSFPFQVCRPIAFRVNGIYQPASNIGQGDFDQLRVGTDLLAMTRSLSRLGNGIYFWENSPARTSLGAEGESKQPDSKIEQPAMPGAVIDLGNCLNLAEVLQRGPGILDELDMSVQKSSASATRVNGVAF